MANNFMANVSEGFDIVNFAEEIAAKYMAQGFTANVIKMKRNVKIKFSKGCGGINTILGMGQGITADLMLSGKESDTLSVSFSDGDWTSKIIACVIGWFLCFIPVITGVIGIIHQLSLPKNIENDMQMLLNDE